MDTQTMTPDSRLYGHKMYGRAADAFDAVAWRPPTARRFDSRPANDVAEGEPDSDAVEISARWVITIGGGVVAALLGAMMGGALSL